MRMMKELKEEIYLAGSFYDFRDKIISSLPEFNFSDPRIHRQHSIATLVEDDINEAIKCPVLLACFPKGKSRGTMTYAEIGASRTRGNCIIIADETGQRDSFLDSVSDYKIGSIGEAIDFLKNNKLERNPSKTIIKKQKNSEGLDIFLAANKEYFGEIEKIEQDDKRITHYDDLKGLADFGKFDLTVIHFPKGVEIDRKAVFFAGMSYALEIPVISIEENPVPYPPLLGLARRVFYERKPALYYLNNLTERDSLKIDNEARLMYDIFKKFNTK